MGPMLMGAAAEPAPGTRVAPAHPLPKPTLGSPGKAQIPGRNHPDGESFYFLSIFVFSRAGLDYSFQQHKVLERLSSQRSVFSALGATFLCTRKRLFSPVCHHAQTWLVTPGTVAAAWPAGGRQGPAGPSSPAAHQPSPGAAFMEDVEAFCSRALRSNWILPGKKPQLSSATSTTLRCSTGWGPSAAASAPAAPSLFTHCKALANGG